MLHCESVSIFSLHMSAKIPEIPCEKCEGRGRHQLNPPLWETLKVLRRSKSAHAKQLCEVMPYQVQHAAMNNRLERLRDLGFVTRVRVGAHLVYSPI